MEAFLAGFEKRAFIVDPGIAGMVGGLTAGHRTGRGMAGTTANMLSREGSKVKNEELARNLAHVTAPIGALVGLGLAAKHRGKVMDLIRNKATKDPQMLALAAGLLPFLSGVGGGGVAGAATGALTSLRRKKTRLGKQAD